MKLLKLEMRLNTELMKEVGKYSPDVVFKCIDESFLECGFRKEVLQDGTICFWGNRHPDDYGNFGGLITSLKLQDWFMPYVEKWLWYNSDGQLDEECYRVEDVLYHYTQIRSV